MSGHTSRSCADRQGSCPISLLCGCACHAEVQEGVQELAPRELAGVLLAAALAGMGATSTPHRDAQRLVDTLERYRLRIVSA